MNKRYYTLAPRVMSCALVEQRRKMKPGEVLPEDYFMDGQLVDLLRRKFLVECAAPTPAASASFDGAQDDKGGNAPAAEGGAVSEGGSFDGAQDDKGGKKPEEMDLNELRGYLTGLQIPFSPNANKTTLLKLVPVAPASFDGAQDDKGGNA